MDSEVRSAVSKSHLCELPSDVLHELLQDGIHTEVPAGSVTHWEGDDRLHFELVVSGVVRVFVTAPDGRTMTIRYCRSGALIGAMSLFADAFAIPATTQALVDTKVLRISPAVARHLALRDTRVARVLMAELSERALNFVHEITGSAFATVQQRVARHLLDIASDPAPKGPSAHGQTQRLTVPITQQELADAVGSVREVIVRVLRELRNEGVVRTERDGIVILDPDRLAQEQGWNQSR